MSYSIWIVPQEEPVKSYFHQTIIDLVEKYNGVKFEPHTTILGDLQLPLETITPGIDSLASKMVPFTVETGAVEYSTTYYQCLFVRLKPNPALMSLYDETKKTFNLTQPSVFMPHMSLYYGNISYQDRHQMMNAINLAPQTFTIDSLILTPGGEHLPSEWEHVYTQHFAK